MEKEEKKYFKLLKNKVISVFRKDFSYVPEDPIQWKISHINYFQEHLFQKTKGNFSDRWFYTYFKNESDKIPRIDMLNILAEYANYEDWDDFVNQQKKEDATIPPKINAGSSKNKSITKTKTVSKPASNLFKNKKQISLIGAFGILLLVAVCVYYFDKSSHEYNFYFRDLDRFGDDSRGYKGGVAVLVPSNLDNPRMYTDSSGKITVFSRADKIDLYLDSPLYKKDTFTINLKKSSSTTMVLDLIPNDYAQMMYYYSYSLKPGVEKRKRHLNRLIADDALIYQVYDNESYGQEVLSKEQYIALMTIPTQSLKNYILIDTDEKNGKFTRIKFKIVQDEEIK